MSVRAAAILIGVFALGAVVFAWFIMGSAGVEFAVVGLIIAVVSATVGIVGPAIVNQKPRPRK